MQYLTSKNASFRCWCWWCIKEKSEVFLANVMAMQRFGKGYCWPPRFKLGNLVLQRLHHCCHNHHKPLLAKTSSKSSQAGRSSTRDESLVVRNFDLTWFTTKWMEHHGTRMRRGCRRSRFGGGVARQTWIFIIAIIGHAHCYFFCKDNSIGREAANALLGPFVAGSVCSMFFFC